MVQVSRDHRKSEHCVTHVSCYLQGKTKGLQTKAPSSRHAAKAAANMKKGQRHIAPKKAALIKQATMKQVSNFPTTLFYFLLMKVIFCAVHSR
jgi:hypothetical protein